MSALQRVILEIYKCVKTICEQEGIRYFAIGGTAIGAVRHGGFIPWDDDLDIAMPIEDYERFIAIAPKLLPEQYCLRTQGDCLHNQEIFAKVVDARTTAIEPHELGFPDAYKGIWLDVMPMSGVPSGIKGKLFCGKIVAFSMLNRGLRFPLSVYKTRNTRLAWMAAAAFRPFIQPEKVTDKWMKSLRDNPFDSAENVGYTWYYWLPKLVFPKAWFDSTLDMRFEDTQIPMPVGYNEYLTMQFGDYMAIPEEGARESHNMFVDFDRPFSEYAAGRLKVDTFGQTQ